MPWPKFNKGERRRITVFLSSLAGAVFLWLFFALSNTYTYPVKFTIESANASQNPKYRVQQTDSVETKVEGSGWQLIFSKMRPEPQKLKINLKTIHEQSFIPLQTELKNLNKQLSSGQKIINIIPDTLFFRQNGIVSKTVPVKLFYQIQFQSGYGLAAPIELSPALVTLSGPAADMNKIQEVSTEILRNTQVNNDFKHWVNLKTLNAKKIKVYPQQILVTVPVSNYTEKVLNLDIQIRNNALPQPITLYPRQVKVSFSTPLTNYPFIEADDFEAYIDLETWRTKKISRLPIKFGRMPNFIKILKIEPQNADFIINP